MTLAQHPHVTTPGRSPAGRVLQVGPPLPAVEAELPARFDAVRLPSATEEFLAARGAEFVAAITSGRVGVDTGTVLTPVPGSNSTFDTTEVIR